jgi:hypothetical protein
MDASLPMRPNTDDKWSGPPEKRKIRVRQYLPMAQMCRLFVGGPQNNRRHIQQSHRCGESLKYTAFRNAHCSVRYEKKQSRLVPELAQAKERIPQEPLYDH